MKFPIIVFIVFLNLVFSSFLFSQTKYYVNNNGEMLIESEYKEVRDERLNKIKRVDKKTGLYEDLTIKYKNIDSVVYDYQWVFTRDIEKAKKEILMKKSLIGKIFPLHNFKTITGENINIDSLKGKPTLINLWFIGCGICILEMPALNEMNNEHGDRFNFVSITFSEKKKVMKLFKKVDFNFTHITDCKELTIDIGFNGYPVNIFLDKDGKVAKIDGNIPVKKVENGKIDFGDGEEFILILESLLN